MAAPIYTAPAVNRGVGDQSAPQASLRDFLNSRMAPFLKRAIKQSLIDEPDYPLRYLGEHLINQSLQYEHDPKNTDIKSHFQYKFDRPEYSRVSEFEPESEPSPAPAPAPAPAPMAGVESMPESGGPAIQTQTVVNGAVASNGTLHEQDGHVEQEKNDVEMNEGSA